MTLREKRYHATTSTLAKIVAQRDACLATLIRHETRLKTLRKQAQRLEKAMAEPAKAPPPPRPAPPAPPKPVAAVTDIPVSEFPIADKIDDEIPDFLRRKKDADRRDAVAADSIRREQAERKRIKAHNRIEEMKAKKRGDTTKMPLSYRNALAAIMAK